MARYSLASRLTNVTTGAAAWELRSTATDRLFVREIGIAITTAVASTFGLGRPAAIGVTPTSPVTVLAMDPANPAGTGTVALAWGTGPTIPTQFIRRIGLPATIGAGVIWTFGEQGLIVPVSSSIILWNLSATSPADVYVEIDE